MSKRGRQLAGQWAAAHLDGAGITKSAGGIQLGRMVEQCLPLAEGVAVIEKAARKLAERERRVSAVESQLGEQIDQVGQQIRMLQALSSVEHVPAVPAFAAFDPSRFRLQAVPNTPPATLADLPEN